MELENTKYYTPLIEEFYVGFEYETYGVDSDGITQIWIKSIFKQDDYIGNNCNNSIIGDFIRVKYLDKEDIEDLGWIYEQSIGLAEFYKNKNKCSLVFWNDSGNHLELSREEEYDIGFWGRCKNKSELIKLMKQLGINS